MRRLTTAIRNGKSSSRLLSAMFSLIGIAALLSCASGCQHAAPAAEAKQASLAKEPEPLKAAVMTVQPQTWPRIVRCQGSLVADDQTVIGSRVAGLVSATLVDIGDAVEPGQILVSLDDREFVLQLAAAEAALLQARSLIGLRPGDPMSKLDPLNAPPVREARATFDEATDRRLRWEKLRQQNAVAEEELQTLVAAEKVAEARYASAINGVNSNIALVAVRAAEVELAKQRIADAQIVSPFAGFVQQRFVAVGTYVQIGSPLVNIVQLGSLRFRGTVPERLATEIKVGQPVKLTVESIEKPLDAKVTRISPALDMASRSLAFEALVDNRDGTLRAGLFAEAEVTIDATSKALVIQDSSLVEFAGSQKVWKLVDGTAKEQKVEPGRRRNGLVEIIEGLKPGDQIIVDGAIGRVAKVIPHDEAAVLSKTALIAATGDESSAAGKPATGDSSPQASQEQPGVATQPGVEARPGNDRPPAAAATAVDAPADSSGTDAQTDAVPESQNAG